MPNLRFGDLHGVAKRGMPRKNYSMNCHLKKSMLTNWGYDLPGRQGLLEKTTGLHDGKCTSECIFRQTKIQDISASVSIIVSRNVKCTVSHNFKKTTGAPLYISTCHFL